MSYVQLNPTILSTPEEIKADEGIDLLFCWIHKDYPSRYFSVINYPFKHSHCALILMYLVSQINKKYYQATKFAYTKTSAMQIAIDCHLPTSKVSLQYIRETLYELHENSFIDLKKSCGPQKNNFKPRKVDLEKEKQRYTESLKRGEYGIEIREEMIYGKSRDPYCVPIPNHIFTSNDLTTPEKLMYITIAKQQSVQSCKGKITLQTLADHLYTTKGSVSKTVSKLVKKGYIKKEPHPTQHNLFIYTTKYIISNNVIK